MKKVKILLVLSIALFIFGCLSQTNGINGTDNKPEDNKPPVVTEDYSVKELDLSKLVYTKDGAITYPMSGMVFIAEKDSEEATKAIKRADGVTTPTDDTIQAGKNLATVVATYSVPTGNTTFLKDDEVGIYFFVNNKSFDYVKGVVVDDGGTLKVGYTGQDGSGDAKKITLKPASEYTLNEGVNNIALVLQHLRTGTLVYVGDATGSAPVNLTVDSIAPALTITYPVNNQYLNFDAALAGTSGTIKLALNASDAYNVTLYGALLSDNGISNAAAIKALGIIKRSGAEISASTAINVSLADKIDLNVNVLAGTGWYLYILAEDANGNQSFEKIKIAGPDRAADISVAAAATNLKVKIGSGVYVPYTAGMNLNSTTFAVEYKTAGTVGGVKDTTGTMTLIRKETVGTTPVIKAQKLLTHEPNSEVYVGTFDLESEFGFTSLNTQEEIKLILHLKDQALNEDQVVLSFVYIDEGAVDTSLKDSDILFDDVDVFAAALTTPLIDNIENKVYFDFDGTAAIDIKSIQLTNPDKLPYQVRVGDEAGVTSSTGDMTKFNISDILLDLDKQREVIKIYLGERLVKTVELILLVDFADNDEDGTPEAGAANKIAITSFTMEQNKDKATISGTVAMPAEVKAEYEIQAAFTNSKNNAANTSHWITLTNINVIDKNNISFSGRIDFDFDAAAEGNYDTAKIRVYHPLATNTNTGTTPEGIILRSKTAVLDDASDLVLSVNAVKLGTPLDNAIEWEISTETQDLNVDMTRLSSVQLYLNDILYSTCTVEAGAGNFEFNDVDFTGKTNMKLIATAKAPASPVVKVQREITIKRPGASETPVFVEVPETNTLYNQRKFVIEGKVSNADKVEVISVKKGLGDVTFVTGKYSVTSPLALTLLPDGKFYSANLADDALYTFVAAAAGTYTDFAGGEGIIEGKEYIVTIRATKENGAFLDYTYTGKFDNLAPTEYYARDVAGHYNKFGDNTTTQWEGIVNLYFDENGALKQEVPPPGPDIDYPTGALEFITPGTDYTIPTKGLNYSFNLAEAVGNPDIDQGYMALIQNQKGYNDYLLMYVPVSESDGSYTAVATEENITVVVTDENNNTLLSRMIKSTDTGKSREILLNLGDNRYETINVYLKDEHMLKTATYTFTNNIYLAIKQSDIRSRIYEGATETTPYKELFVSQITGLDKATLNIYKGSTTGEFLVSVPNIDLSTASGYILPVSGDIVAGDVLAIQAVDKYGNTVFREDYTGFLTSVIKDDLIPLLPVNVAVANKPVGQLDVITGESEEGATIIVKDGANNEIARTTAGADKKFTVSINGDAYPVVKLEVVDKVGNTTANSLVHEAYLIISDKFARAYNYPVTGVNATAGTFKRGQSITVTWNKPSESPADIAMGNVLSKYRVDFKNGANIIATQEVTTQTLTIKPEDIGAFNLNNIDINVYGISALGLVSPVAGSTVVKMDSTAPDIAALDKTLVKASVLSDTISVMVGALDTAKAGIGASDKLYLSINGVLKEYIAGNPLLYTVVETGAIENDTTFNVKIVDLAGNESDVTVINSTDDMPPSIDDIVRVSSVNTFTEGGITKTQVTIKHKTEDNVTVYAYNTSVVDANGKPTGALIGVIALKAKNVVNGQENILNINSDDHANIYLFLKDTAGNYSIAKVLTNLAAEQ